MIAFCKNLIFKFNRPNLRCFYPKFSYKYNQFVDHSFIMQWE